VAVTRQLLNPKTGTLHATSLLISQDANALGR